MQHSATFLLFICLMSALHTSVIAATERPIRDTAEEAAEQTLVASKLQAIRNYTNKVAVKTFYTIFEKHFREHKRITIESLVAALNDIFPGDETIVTHDYLRSLSPDITTKINEWDAQQVFAWALQPQKLQGWIDAGCPEDTGWYSNRSLFQLSQVNDNYVGKELKKLFSLAREEKNLIVKLIALFKIIENVDGLLTAIGLTADNQRIFKESLRCTPFVRPILI